MVPTWFLRNWGREETGKEGRKGDFTLLHALLAHHSFPFFPSPLGFFPVPYVFTYIYSFYILYSLVSLS